MYSAGFFFVLFVLLLAAIKCNSEAGMQDCHASCGTLANISYPFGLEQSPKTGCPKPLYNLTCKRDRAILYVKERPFYVMNISYENASFWLIDSVLQRDNCSSLLSYASFSFPNYYPWNDFYTRRVVYVNCLVPVKDPAYVPAAPCSLSSPSYLYAILRPYMSIRSLNTSCKVVMKIPTSFDYYENATTHSQIVSILMRGFQVEYWSLDRSLDRSFKRVCADTIVEDCLRRPGLGCSLINMIATWKRCLSVCERSSKWHQCLWKNLGRYLKDFWTVVSYNVFYRHSEIKDFHYNGIIGDF